MNEPQRYVIRTGPILIFIPAMSLTSTALPNIGATKEQRIKIKVHTHNEEILSTKNRFSP